MAGCAAQVPRPSSPASLLAGVAARPFGLVVTIWLNAVLLGVAALCALPLPNIAPRSPEAARQTQAGGVLTLLQLPVFGQLMLTAALVLGSHAMHDSFAMISWNAAGIDTGTASLIWSESVAAEVIMFFLFGPALLNRLGPGRAAALAAGAGMLRWAVMATSTQVIALSLIEPLHGFTFALLHLACMRVIAETVPSHLAATAQALYGTLAAGAANALLTLGSGWLYAHFGVGGILGDGGAMRRGSAGRARPRTILRRMRSETLASRAYAARCFGAADGAFSSNSSASFSVITPPSSSASTIVTARR